MKASWCILALSLQLFSCAGQSALVGIDTDNATATCSTGVCKGGKWALYLSGKTSSECKKICDDGRKMVAIPDGVQMDVFRFRQNGRFINVKGGKNKAAHEAKVTKVNYRSGRHFPGWPSSMRDHFYGRWECELSIKKAGTYKFWTQSDDGSRVNVDGKEIVTNGGWHGMRWSREGAVAMAAGSKHPLWAEFFEGGGGAGMRLYWQGPDSGNRRQFLPSSACTNGIKEQGFSFRQNGRFHDMAAWLAKVTPAKTPTWSSKVTNINYGSTGGYWPGIWTTKRLKDHFYVHWSGYIEIKTAGKYTFTTQSDDGSRLNIDGKNVVNNPGWHGMRERHGVVDAMTAGKHQFWAEMFEGGGGAGMKLMYNGPDTNNAKTVVPAAVLSGSLAGTGKMELNADWKARGKCEAYSHQGTSCILYTGCTEVSSAMGTTIGGDKDFDWAGELASFNTCKF